jgi:hypothetical protein
LIGSPNVTHIHVVQSYAIDPEPCKSVGHPVSGGMVKEIGSKAGVRSPKPDSPFLGCKMSVFHADEPMLACRGVKPFGNIRDIVRRVERNHKGKQFILRRENRRDCEK